MTGFRNLKESKMVWSSKDQEEPCRRVKKFRNIKRYVILGIEEGGILRRFQKICLADYRERYSHSWILRIHGCGILSCLWYSSFRVVLPCTRRKRRKRRSHGGFWPAAVYFRWRDARAVSSGRGPSIPWKLYKHFIPVGMLSCTMNGEQSPLM